jgi:hypothetical protein
MNRVAEKGMPESAARGVMPNLRSEEPKQDIDHGFFHVRGAGRGKHREHIEAFRGLGG